MATLPLQSDALPVLRPDVEFHRGPDELDGAPTYVLHDPLQGTFEKLSWVQAEILRRLRVPSNATRLCDKLADTTTIQVSPDDVRQLCANAAQRGLTLDTRVSRADGPDSCRPHSASPGPTEWFRKLVFFRIPLLHPDGLLERTVGVVRHLGRPAALSVYLCCAVLGLVLLIQRFESYVATFPYFFNLTGALAFGVTVAVVKIVHEFGHAYVAKAHGIRVPTMGVALILLFPVAFADVTDGWRMRNRRQRLWISLAGVFAELVIAGAALVGWALSPDGVFKSVCFVISSVTLLSTLLINLNPAMRYDGYYVLSDLLGIDNLQSRAFAAIRWGLRSGLLGMHVAPPEADWTRRRVATLTLYAVGAWAYRLFLYSAIALALYHRVTKVLGIVLFGLAIFTFLVRPVMAELKGVWGARRLLRPNLRLGLTALALGTLLAWAALPLPRRRALPAVTVAENTQVIYAPGSGVLRDVQIARGSRVHRGQELFRVESEVLEHETRRARLDIERIDIELALLRGDELQRGKLPQKLEERARAKAHLDTLLTARNGNRFVAQLNGAVIEWDESLREGMPIGGEQILGRIGDPRAPRIVCYASHDVVRDLAVGDAVTFCATDRPGSRTGTVRFVDPVRTAYLPQRGLASVAGGPIPVVPNARGQLEIVAPRYAVEVVVFNDDAALRVGQTGWIWLRTAPRSHLFDLLCYGARILVRESSF